MTGPNLLSWLNGHTDLELSFQHSDDDDDFPGSWCVYQVRGSVNDREWRLIASAATLYEAIRQARNLLKEAAR